MIEITPEQVWELASGGLAVLALSISLVRARLLLTLARSQRTLSRFFGRLRERVSGLEMRRQHQREVLTQLRDQVDQVVRVQTDADVLDGQITRFRRETEAIQGCVMRDLVAKQTDIDLLADHIERSRH